jgi:hypothetical protein
MNDPELKIVFKAALENGYHSAGMMMLTAMQFPHWMMVAGAVLVTLGFIGFAFSNNRNLKPDRAPTEMKAKEENDV